MYRKQVAMSSKDTISCVQIVVGHMETKGSEALLLARERTILATIAGIALRSPSQLT